ncbi:MAG: flagellar assembly protein FliW [Lentisphaeraceae bacterium]|nr:flagellar assembly protein FliW [Lentisphaeraceae bacterium]
MNETIDFGTATAMEIRDGAQSTIVPLENEVIFEFEEGLPAFENCKEFVFILEKDLQPFICMQSLNKQHLSFVCIDPFTIKKEYTVRLQEGILDKMKIKSQEDLLILSVVTVNPDMTKTTANLMGPIILNLKTNKGMQVILEDVDPELVRFNVWDGISEVEAEHEAIVG